MPSWPSGLLRMHPVGSGLRLARRCEDRARLILQQAKPGSDIGSVIAPRFVRDTKVGEHERRRQLGGHFFHRERLSRPLAGEVAIEAMLGAGCMGAFVNVRCVKAERFMEGGKGRHVDAIFIDAVISARGTENGVDAKRADEGLGR